MAFAAYVQTTTAPLVFVRLASSISKSRLCCSFSSKMQGVESSKEDAPVNIPGAESSNRKRKVFVAGATGNTGKRVVEHLLSKGFEVRAGVRNVEKAKTIFSNDLSSLEIVKADVTDGATKLADAIGVDCDAVICATGFRPGFDLFAPWKVDYSGTINLVEACRAASVKRFVLVSSILVNGAAMGQILNPAYIFLNVFGLTLVAKLQAEKYVRKSGINYTIVRPGGLRNDPPTGNLVMEPEDTLYQGSISRDTVAEVAVEALDCADSFYKVVEVVSRPDAPGRPLHDLFRSINESNAK